MRRFLSLFWIAFQDWRRDRADRLAAALAYYSILSIPPLLLLILGIAGLVFGPESVQGRLLSTLEQLLGPRGTAAIRDLLSRMGQSGQGVTATVVGIGSLILGAAGVFGHLKDTLDTIWNVRQEKGTGWKGWLRDNVFSIVVLMGAAFLLVVSLAVNAVLAAAGDFLSRALPGGSTLWWAANFVVSLSVLAGLFTLMFRYIPAAKVRWPEAGVGGAVTAVLFVIGESAIGFYLGKSSVGSAFGVAGSLVVFLVWVYYSALVFFYGAEFTRGYSHRSEPRRMDRPQVRGEGVR